MPRRAEPAAGSLPFEPLDATVRRVETALERGDLDAALESIVAQVEGWLAFPELTRNALWGSRALDALAARAGALAAAGPRSADAPALPPRPPGKPLDAYLFTRTEYGGHVLVAGDLVRAAPDRASVVLLTRQDVLPVPAVFAERFATPPERIVALPHGSALERTRTLIGALERLRPERVFVFNHHEDAPAVAAASAYAGAAETYYVHHGDFEPALGVFMPGARHLDLTPRAHTFCAHALGLASAYVPLVAADRGRRPRRAPRHGGPVLATCGGPSKYDLGYRLPYPTVLAELLARTDAVFHHIGPLYEYQIAAVREALAAASVDPARWNHLPDVPSLWDALGELGVDLYVNSFPQRGARAAVEVMGSGTPAVWHVTDPRYASVDLHLAYPEAASWGRTDELVAIVAGLDADWTAAQSDAARAHYERAHHPAILAAVVASAFRLSPPVPAAGARSFAFEFEHLERSWHRLADRVITAAAAPDSRARGDAEERRA